MMTALIILVIMFIVIDSYGTSYVCLVQFRAARHTARAIMISILVFFAGVNSAHGAEAFEREISNKQTTVTVLTPDTRSASWTFRVVLVCDTDESKKRGLEGFRRLMPDEAALFVFDKPEEVTFWMGSVAFPIDIIFIGSDNKVIRVYRNCRPGSRALYPSIERVKWALEIAPGSRIKIGDRIIIN